MRQAFVQALVHEAEVDERILLLTADLGFAALEPFRDRFPDRFFNVGVAEQNMVGMATGLADAGFTPFLYSIATFATMRPYEFIRNGPVLHELPVRVVGMGGGLDYGTNGLTHYALEDVALMRAQPGMTVFVPADDGQTSTTVRFTTAINGPVYLRLEKAGPPVPGLDPSRDPLEAQMIRSGDEIVLIAMGGVARDALAAAELLGSRGLDAGVVVVSALSPAALDPAPAGELLEALERSPVAVTVESHYVVGGLGSLVCEIVAEHGLSCRVARCGVRGTPRGETGSRDGLYRFHGLDAAGIVESAEAALARSPRTARSNQ